MSSLVNIHFFGVPGHNPVAVPFFSIHTNQQLSQMAHNVFHVPNDQYNVHFHLDGNACGAIIAVVVWERGHYIGNGRLNIYAHFTDIVQEDSDGQENGSRTPSADGDGDEGTTVRGTTPSEFDLGPRESQNGEGEDEDEDEDEEEEEQNPADDASTQISADAAAAHAALPDAATAVA
ncbi:hypothetical protein K491DRAFT_720764 [Lophiostoma macrostomum CBS 122681]|uniref:Uncharacterized protein n=1 Tax=Lophiostoma macrostomum CBS 122681 TaxID=1314788 RepID=A0A6A6SUZ8_9PLEO|nr:hypothetical protein K491DRAFT_720764 [Lophiostoma macrostomum CBS 122681]